MAKVIIIHGTGGSPSGNWFPWLSKELENLGHSILVPKMPTPENQSLLNWFLALEEQNCLSDELTVFIGHSVGAVFLLRYLEEKVSKPLCASIFVSGFVRELNLEKFDRLNSSFIKDSYDWDIIKKNAGEILCIFGDNDPYVPIEQSVELALNLNVDPIIIKNGGHLNEEFGYIDFPLLREMLTVLLGKK
jgi:predicted alpha/beta hydrolase family esterase